MLYVEDITFLGVNTKEKYGTHLNTYLWQLHLPERRISLLRSLCTYSDRIAYLVSSPAEILLEETQRLSSILSELSDNQLIFTYHQLRDARGLLSYFINNRMLHIFTFQLQPFCPYSF